MDIMDNIGDGNLRQVADRRTRSDVELLQGKEALIVVAHDNSGKATINIDRSLDSERLEYLRKGLNQAIDIAIAEAIAAEQREKEHDR